VARGGGHGAGETVIRVDLTPKRRSDVTPAIHRPLRLPGFLAPAPRPPMPFRGPIEVNLLPGRRIRVAEVNVSPTLIVWIAMILTVIVSWFVA
jgi:hypothetical protein